MKAGQVHQTIPAQLPTTPGPGVELGSNVSTGLGLTGHAARVLPPPRHASLFAARFHLLRPADVARLLGSAGGQSPCLGPAMTRPRAVPPPAPPWPPPTPTWPSPGAASLLLPWPPLLATPQLLRWPPTRAASLFLRACTCSGRTHLPSLVITRQPVKSHQSKELTSKFGDKILNSEKNN